ncbi:MAG: Uncharacterised protein [Flavobacteriia bacterium]|nr:MAG: Uncharacterised protein [Flavobacteriia bacterium]
MEVGTTPLFSYRSTDFAPELVGPVRIYYSHKLLLCSFFNPEGRLLWMQEFELPEEEPALHAMHLLRRIRDEEGLSKKRRSIQFYSGQGALMALPKERFTPEQADVLFERSGGSLKGCRRFDRPGLSGTALHFSVPSDLVDECADWTDRLEVFPVSQYRSESLVQKEGMTLVGFMHPGRIDVALYQSNQLMLMNRFSCAVTEDFSYHLLNCGQQMDWSVRTDPIVLTGREERMEAVHKLLKEFVGEVWLDDGHDAPEIQRLALLGE